MSSWSIIISNNKLVLCLKNMRERNHINLSYETVKNSLMPILLDENKYSTFYFEEKNRALSMGWRSDRRLGISIELLTINSRHLYVIVEASKTEKFIERVQSYLIGEGMS